MFIPESGKFLKTIILKYKCEMGLGEKEYFVYLCFVARFPRELTASSQKGKAERSLQGEENAKVEDLAR